MVKIGNLLTSAVECKKLHSVEFIMDADFGKIAREKERQRIFLDANFCICHGNDDTVTRIHSEVPWRHRVFLNVVRVEDLNYGTEIKIIRIFVCPLVEAAELGEGIVDWSPAAANVIISRLGLLLCWCIGVVKYSRERSAI